MKMFPLFVALQGQRVLVVGGGDVAERKIGLLLQAGARVRVLSPQCSAAVQRLVAAHADTGQVELVAQPYDGRWMDDVQLVISATDAPDINRQVAADARARRLWVNAVDDSASSTCHIPAIVDREPVTIAVSSCGVAPMIARRIREQLEALLDASPGQLAQLAGGYRAAIRQAYPDMPGRRALYEWMLDGPVLHALRMGDAPAAHRLLQDALATRHLSATGSVALLEAGPGHPDLMPLLALRVLNQAGLILADPAVPAAVLEMARRDAVRMVLPESDAVPAMLADSLPAVWQALLEYVGRGECVAVVKMGNPFSQATDSAEAVFLKQRGVDCRIIPAITALQAWQAGLPGTSTGEGAGGAAVRGEGWRQITTFMPAQQVTPRM